MGLFLKNKSGSVLKKCKKKFDFLQKTLAFYRKIWYNNRA